MKEDELQKLLEKVENVLSERTESICEFNKSYERLDKANREVAQLLHQIKIAIRFKL